MYVTLAHDATMLSATIHSYKEMENLTPCNFIPLLPIITKLGMIYYIWDPYPYAKFCNISFAGEFPTNTSGHFVLSHH